MDVSELTRKDIEKMHRYPHVPGRPSEQWIWDTPFFRTHICPGCGHLSDHHTKFRDGLIKCAAGLHDKDSAFDFDEGDCTMAVIVKDGETADIDLKDFM